MVAAARYGEPDFGKLRRCACLSAEATAARMARAARILSRVAGELGTKLGACTFDNFDLKRTLASLVWWSRDGDDDGTRSKHRYDPAEQRQLLSAARGIGKGYAATENLYLYGPNGSGKSHLAAAILNAQAAHGVGGHYRTMPELLLLIQQGFDRSDEDKRRGAASGSERLDALLVVPLLVIDDLGAEKGSEWADQTLFTLINTRINHGRATIVTSNYPPDQHRDPRISSRFAGDYTPVPLITSDYRMLQAQSRTEAQ